MLTSTKKNLSHIGFSRSISSGTFSGFRFIRTCNLVLIALFSTFSISDLYAQNDSELLESFIKSKGYSDPITFSPQNIKQYWINNSVSSKDDFINVLLNKNGYEWESDSYDIKLKNVSVTSDCKVEVISETSDLHFTILNDASKKIAQSTAEDKFLGYSISSATFQLADTSDYFFKIAFSSRHEDLLKINKIILSFSQNNSFLASPGTLKFNDENISTNAKVSINDDKSFEIKGKNIQIFAKDKILITNNPLVNSVSVKNTGETPIRVDIGYSPYTKDGVKIDNRFIPYDKTTVNVVSSDGNFIVVDKMPTWKKGCYITLNAKNDLSDFPNPNILNNPILDIVAVDGGQAKIVLEKPLERDIPKESSIRVHSQKGLSNIYTNRQIVPPGEEIKLSSSMAPDDSYLQYNAKAFCRGTYYVIPFLLITSTESNSAVSVYVSDYSVKY